MKARIGLGFLFFTWLYGTTFLALVGLSRRATPGFFPNRLSAEQFGAATDHFLTAAIVLDIVAPIAGAAIAIGVKDGYWRRHFGFALIGMLIVLFGYAVVESKAMTPLIGSVPVDYGPAPVYTGCVAYSGGRNTCPGG